MQGVQALLGSSCFIAAALVVACDGSSAGNEPQDCNAAGCSFEDTSEVQLSLSGPGTYRFEVTIDGEGVRCTATLPLDAQTTACTDDRLNLLIAASGTEGAPQTIEALYVRGDATTKRVEVRAFRDNAAVGSAAFDVEHTETPGPNGPGCQPEVCRVASGGTLL